MKHSSNGGGACLCDGCCARARTVAFGVHGLGNMVSSAGRFLGLVSIKGPIGDGRRVSRVRVDG